MTNDTVARECRMMSHELLCFILNSRHKKWRGYKAAVKAELAWRSGTRRLG